MASNLQSARQAIKAELSYAKQGAAYYEARVEALETALHQLDNVEGDAPASSSTARAGTEGRKANGGARLRRARAANGAVAQHAGEAKRGRKRAASKQVNDVPATGGDFWLRLVSEQPRSAVDIANAAIETLGIAPDQKDQIQKLKQRVSPALAGLVSAHKIKDSGAGRARRFYKADQPDAA